MEYKQNNTSGYDKNITADYDRSITVYLDSENITSTDSPITHYAAVNVSDVTRIELSSTSFELSSLQLYFLIVLVLAVSNLFLGVLYACLHYRHVICYHCCQHEDDIMRGRHRASVQPSRGKPRANLMMGGNSRGRISIQRTPTR